MTGTLPPTPRTTPTRARERFVAEREEMLAFLGEGFVAHVGVVVDEHPLVLPVAYAVDRDGPDEAGSLYLHGSVGAGWIRRVGGTVVCVTVSEVDGLVLARSVFHHSMNYRSAVVIGTARIVEDAAERDRALHAVVEQIVPGRAATLRASTRKELAATAVLAVALAEASYKVRAGGPNDDEADEDPGVWAGHLPLGRTVGEVVSAPDVTAEVPPEVVARAAGLRARPARLGR